MLTSRDESATTEKALPIIFTYLCGLAKSSDAGLQDIAVQEYSSLLYGRKTRAQFWNQRSETLGPLVKILHAAAGINSSNASVSLWSGNATARNNGAEGGISGGVGLQLLYHVLLVVWQLSFEAEEIGEELNEYVLS